MGGFSDTNGSGGADKRRSVSPWQVADFVDRFMPAYVAYLPGAGGHSSTSHLDLSHLSLWNHPTSSHKMCLCRAEKWTSVSPCCPAYTVRGRDRGRRRRGMGAAAAAAAAGGGSVLTIQVDAGRNVI